MPSKKTIKDKIKQKGLLILISYSLVIIIIILLLFLLFSYSSFVFKMIDRNTFNDFNQFIASIIALLGIVTALIIPFTMKEIEKKKEILKLEEKNLNVAKILAADMQHQMTELIYFGNKVLGALTKAIKDHKVEDLKKLNSMGYLYYFLEGHKPTQTDEVFIVLLSELSFLDSVTYFTVKDYYSVIRELVNFINMSTNNKTFFYSLGQYFIIFRRLSRQSIITLTSLYRDAIKTEEELTSVDVIKNPCEELLDNLNNLLKVFSIKMPNEATRL